MLVLGQNPGGLRPLTPSVLLSNTAPNIINYSVGCTSLREMGKGEDWQAPPRFRRLSALGPVYRQFFRVQCTVKYPGKSAKTGKPKKVILCWAGRPSPGLKQEEMVPGRPSADNPLWVSCSCKYFRYVCEWALTRYGSSDIVYSNGQPARYTNPRGIGTLCKHLYVAIPFAIQGWVGESPEQQAVEEPLLEETPQVPAVTPTPSPAEEVQVEDSPEEVEDEGLRGAFFYPKYSIMAHSLRSLALTFDSECC